MGVARKTANVSTTANSSILAQMVQVNSLLTSTQRINGDALVAQTTKAKQQNYGGLMLLGDSKTPMLLSFK